MTTRDNPKRLLLLLLAAAVAISALVLALNYYEQRAARKTKIIFISKTADEKISFWRMVRLGAEAAGKEFGLEVSVRGPNSESEVAAQSELIRAAIAEKPDAILLSAADYTGQTELCRQIVEGGIKLITVDSDIDGDFKTAFIGTNNYDAGKKAGESLRQLLQPGDAVGLISFVPGTRTAMERERGFRDGLGEGHPIVGPLYCNTNYAKAQSLAEGLLREHPEVRGMAGLNEPSAAGAGSAVQRVNTSIPVVGIDSSKTEIELLEAGIIRTIVVQKPYNMGYLGVVTAIKAIGGEQVEKVIDTGVQVVTRETMYEKENQKLLFIFADGNREE